MLVGGGGARDGSGGPVAAGLPLVGGDDEARPHAGLIFPVSADSAKQWLLTQAAVPSPGSAIAYCAYSFPDTLVCTPFRDYYMTLAVLNTIISTGLSCYSRYPAAPSQMGRGGGLAVISMDCGRGQRKRHLGAWDKQDALRGHTACAVAQGPTIERAPHLVQCSAIAVQKFLMMFEQGDPTLALCTEPCK